jgi:hypothetical protein
MVSKIDMEQFPFPQCGGIPEADGDSKSGSRSFFCDGRNRLPSGEMEV